MLHRREAIRGGLRDAHKAWRHLVDTGEIRTELVRSHVARAWRRSRACGSSPLDARIDAIDPVELSRLLEAEADLLAAARPYLAALSRSAGPNRHAVILADAEGRVLDVVGDESSVRGPDAVPGPGALLSERCAGANVIGTPLVEGVYVELDGAEHWLAGFHGFTCQGLPLRGADGAIRGVLGVYLRERLAAARVRDILVCAAKGVEAELIAAQLSLAIENAATGSPCPLETLRQDLVQAHAAARLRIDVAAERSAAGGATIRLISAAERLITRFRRQAILWRELADEGLGFPAPVALHERAATMTDLLRTEAATRHVELMLGRLAPLIVRDDERELARALLRTFLDAMVAAGAGGSVQVEVGPLELSSGYVRLTARTTTGRESLHELRCPGRLGGSR